MRFSLPDLAIRRPITVVMLVVTCIGLGVIAARRVSVEFMPPMDLPFLGAFVPYFGATPEQVEQEIAIPAEGEFRTLPSLRRLRTSSSEQGCFIGMRFEWGTDMGEALAEVRDRMERLRLVLPDNVDRIYVRHFSLETIPIMQLGLASEGDHLAFAQRIRKDLLPKLSRLPGVAEVEMFGMDEPTVMVDLDQNALMSRGVSIYELIGKLRVSNVDLGIGEVVDGDKEYHVRVQSRLDSIEDYAQLQLRPELQLQDVAKGAMRSRERDQRFAIDGEQEVFLMITKESEANAAATCERVIAELDRILATPEFSGATYFTFFSQGAVITGALNGLKKASAYGGAMAVVVLFMFLRRVRPTLVVALAIPGSLVVGLVVMYALGMSLNLVTMMSLIIAVGMVVDNAIVVIENIYRHHDLGADAITAARRGAEEVGLAIVASTSTTAVVFLPVFYIDSGQMAVFTRQFAVPVTTALAASLVMALTVIPLAASRFKYYEHSWMERWRRRGSAGAGLASVIGAPARHAASLYVAVMRWSLQQRVAAVALVAALTVFTLAVPARQVGFQSLPSADRRYVDIDVDFDPNYDIRQAEAFFDRVHQIIEPRRGDLGVKHVFENYTARGGEMRLYLTNEEDLGPGESLPFTSEEVMNILWHLFPQTFPGGTISFATGIENAETGTMQAEVTMRLEGTDSDVLRAQADRLVAELEALPGVLEASTDTPRVDPELQLEIDPQLAGLAGVNPTVAAQTVAFALQGTKLSTIKQGDREIEVWSQFGEMDRAGLGNLQNIGVLGSEGRSVPLKQIATVERGRTPQVVNRIDGKNYLWINVRAGSTDLSAIRDQIVGAAAEFDLPPGYRVAMGDELQNMEEDRSNFASILFLAVVLIYIVMAALFESYLLPLSILTTVPLAFLGVYWMLFVTRTSMDTVAFIGCILMVGVVVNNGIVIVDRINQLRAEGMARFDAILQGGRDRLRPVLMTAITTILGAMPLAVGPPLGEPAAISLGRAMIGGLIGGTFLTLFVVPLFYALIDDLRGWLTRFAADLLAARNTPAPIE